MRAVREFICGLLMMVGFGVIVCVAGMSDLNEITLTEMAAGAALGLIPFGLGALGLNWEHERGQR